MRRITAILTFMLTLALALPTSAQIIRPICDDLYAVARLQATGVPGEATGRALVYFDGGVQVVEFATIGIDPKGGVSQVWQFDEGDVTLLELPHPIDLFGPFQSIDSDVAVTSGGSGDWTYEGIWNENTLRATFVVRGDLCVGPTK